MAATINAFFDPSTSTYTYVIYTQPGGHAAIIDPVLNYEPKSATVSTVACDEVIAFIRAQALQLDWILETHAHADHLSGAQSLKRELGGQIGIGSAISQVQVAFKSVFNFGRDFATDGSQFDRLLSEGDTLAVGDLQAQVLAVPGHTPACVAYAFEDVLFVGDTLFMPDVGSARCDFPGGDARMLYRSIRRLLDFPSATRICVCHDYPPAARAPRWATTVGEQRQSNIHVHDGISEAAFVAMRTARDKTLEMPLLIIPAIQVNIRAGQLPSAEDNGTKYLKIPLNTLGR